MAAPTIVLSAAALRSSGLELYGSGGGSIPPKAIFDTFPQLWALAASGKLRLDTDQAPLADVEAIWQRQHLPGRRLVIIPEPIAKQETVFQMMTWPKQSLQPTASLRHAFNADLS